jgi:hypothetical protein
MARITSLLQVRAKYLAALEAGDISRGASIRTQLREAESLLCRIDRCRAATMEFIDRARKEVDRAEARPK